MQPRDHGSDGSHGKAQLARPERRQQRGGSVLCAPQRAACGPAQRRTGAAHCHTRRRHNCTCSHPVIYVR